MVTTRKTVPRSPRTVPPLNAKPAPGPDPTPKPGRRPRADEDSGWWCPYCDHSMSWGLLVCVKCGATLDPDAGLVFKALT